MISGRCVKNGGERETPSASATSVTATLGGGHSVEEDRSGPMVRECAALEEIAAHPLYREFHQFAEPGGRCVGGWARAAAPTAC